jgi:regulator of sigma E protease
MILGFGILVGVHEFGHFIAAKLMGMSVSTFSIGFGPALCRWRWGETEYRISAIPLGGFVHIVGHMEDEKENAKFVEKIREERGADQVKGLTNPDTWFCNKHGLKQLVTILAGPVWSIILAIPFFWGALMIQGEQKLMEPITIHTVLEDSPAANAGFEAKDQIAGVNHQPVATYQDFILALTGADLSEPVPITLNRDGTKVETTLKFADPQSPDMGVVLVGESIRLAPQEALKSAYDQSVDMTKLQATAMYMLFTGQASTSGVAGPIGIFSMGMSMADRGIAPFFHFLGVFTIALGLMNLLPIPGLDGSHILFASWKIMTGKNVPARIQVPLILAGMALLLTLVFLVSIQDIWRIIKPFVESYLGG